jgi:hypothetical protein
MHKGELVGYTVKLTPDRVLDAEIDRLLRKHGCAVCEQPLPDELITQQTSTHPHCRKLNRPGFVGGCVVYATSRSGVAVLACRW